ncbi:helix-turn-helix domain-containing protein [Patulibacter sp. S7RM1-6]
MPLLVPTSPADRPAEVGAGVRSVDRALRVLLAVADGPERTVSGLARHLGAHRSTASRLVAALAAAGFLERLPDDVVPPGPEIERRLCVSGPAYRLTAADLEALAARCGTAAARIGARRTDVPLAPPTPEAA